MEEAKRLPYPEQQAHIDSTSQQRSILRKLTTLNSIPGQPIQYGRLKQEINLDSKSKQLRKRSSKTRLHIGVRGKRKSFPTLQSVLP
jgi:hypothetical protein